MAKKKITPAKKTNEARLGNFIEHGIDKEQESEKIAKNDLKQVKKGRKPKKESDKFKRYNFTFPPEFIEKIDQYLKENPFEASSRSSFIHRIVSLYLRDK